MKIKVFDVESGEAKIYDGNISPVMIILEESDKENIAEMTHKATKYCQYPDEFKTTIPEFMRLNKSDNIETKVD